MAIVIRCDTCDAPLGREVRGVTLTTGTLVPASQQGDARFVPGQEPVEYILCEPCADYVNSAAYQLAVASHGGTP